MRSPEAKPIVLSRRLISFGAIGSMAQFALRSPAAAKCQYASEQRVSKRNFESPAGFYYTYPHCNGFLNDKTIVLARRTSSNVTGFFSYDIQGNEEGSLPRFIAQIVGARMYYSISQNGLLAASTNLGFSVLDLNANGRVVYQYEDSDASKISIRYHGDIDISADGTSVVATRSVYQGGLPISSRVLLFDLAIKNPSIIAEARRDVWPDDDVAGYDHAHFSPNDNSWICFSDGNYRAKKRLHVWHRRLANPSRVLFDQSSEKDYLVLTHERAMFTKPSLLVIADGSSPGHPRGLYEVPFLTEPPRLISESNRDQHCNDSPIGRWQVVSVMGSPRVIDGSSLDLCERAGGAGDAGWLRSSDGYSLSDIVLVDTKNGERSFLADAGASNFGQPFEAQPAFSPDGRWIIFKDGRRRTVRGVTVS